MCSGSGYGVSYPYGYVGINMYVYINYINYIVEYEKVFFELVSSAKMLAGLLRRFGGLVCLGGLFGVCFQPLKAALVGKMFYGEIFKPGIES